MPLVMYNPAYEFPLILVPGSVVHGQTFTYMARQLGVDDDDSSNWRIIPAAYVREDALTVEVTDETLKTLEVFYEQIHTARDAQIIRDPDHDVATSDCCGDTDNVPV